MLYYQSFDSYLEQAYPTAIAYLELFLWHRSEFSVACRYDMTISDSMYGAARR